MHACLDDLVIALYVTIDDLLGPRLGPGRPPKLSDAELVCLAVAQVLLGARSERHWLRFAHARLGHLFPYLPGQAGYDKRLRAAAHLVVLALGDLAVRSPSWCDGFRLLDATPLPCGASRETVKRSALWPHAGYGYDRSHSRWYWGFKPYLLCAPDGMPTSWWLATPELGEREVAQALLEDAARQRALAAGAIILAGKGFAGRAFHQHVGALGVWLIRPDRKDEPRRFGSLGGMRQWIEGVLDTLKDQLGLEHHGGRTLGGVFVRVGQRLLALAAAIWFNWQLAAEDKRSLVAYDRRPASFIFTTSAGLPIRRTRFSDVWRTAAKAAELPAGASFHDLRHYYASLLIQHGESVKVVQKRLGHKSAVETLDTYSHLWPDSEDRTREAVDQVLGY